MKRRDYFYESSTWARLRWMTFKKQGRKCRFCGIDKPGTTFHIDHIKPRSKFPDLELDPSNLQVLCETCNIGKMDDYEEIKIEPKKEKFNLHVIAVRYADVLRDEMIKADDAQDMKKFKECTDTFLRVQQVLARMEKTRYRAKQSTKQ